MKIKAFLSFLFPLLFSTISLFAFNSNPLLWSKGALNQGAFGNPAALTSQNGPAASIRFLLDSSQSLEQWELSQQWSHASLGFKNDGNNRNHLRLSLSTDETQGLQIGAATEAMTNNQNSDLDWAYSLGLAYFPFSPIKLGYQYDFNRSQGADIQSFSVLLRPLSFLNRHPDLLEMGIDWNLFLGDTYQNFDRAANILVKIRPTPPLSIYGNYDLRREAFGMGISALLLPIERVGFFQTEQRSEIAIDVSERSQPGALVHPPINAVLDLNRSIVSGYTPIHWFGKDDSWGDLDLYQMLDQVSKEKSYRKIWVKLGSLQADWDVAENLRKRFLALRKEGIEVHMYLESVSPINYLVASAGTSISMQPQGYFSLLGFAYEPIFFKGLLNKVGVEPQFVRHGKFKSFEETFTRDSMSVESRLNMDGLIQSLWNNYLTLVAESRKINHDSLKNYFNNPDLDPRKAKTAGFIDTLCYEDQAKDLAFDGSPMSRSLVPSPVYRDGWDKPAAIAYIEIDGEIHTGESLTGSLLSHSTSGSETITEALRKAREDKRIEGVLLRINSPGGSALASDVIWREVQLLREAKKPVIASVGGMAASGGYYVMCNADYIVAPANAIVGSIGVLAGKFVLRDLYAKLGIGHDLIKSAPHADGNSNYRPWNEEELSVLQKNMDDFYDTFISKVAAGRKMKKSAVDSAGQGQIFTGTQALSLGLVDKIGAFPEAVSEMKRRLKLDANAPVELVSYKSLQPGLNIPGANLVQNSLVSTRLLPSGLLQSKNQGFEQDLYAIKKIIAEQMPSLFHSSVWAYSPEAEMLSGLHH